MTACGGAAEPANPLTQPAQPAQPATNPEPAGAAAPAQGGAALAKVADVPVGGGLVLPDQEIVLTQPVKGEIKGFTSSCTHYGCTVSGVKGGTINCACHGSKFAVADGAVVNGPATGALPEVAIRVEGSDIFRATPSGM
ncbi:Rieske (2Fe-2S) protein [Dactylosporangium sucinum]|uniref:Rieske (2Fe-2S) protein n=1 Tax=Dactylosporangium sucinum TaxID=1424081 RepID=UPI001E3B93EC|nr:Rieske (2Fe-2S) protein [Dactylosporangium sucinum]